MLIDPTDLENNASDIAVAVDDLKYEVERFRDALRAISDACNPELEKRLPERNLAPFFTHPILYVEGYPVFIGGYLVYKFFIFFYH